jgi:hypothetical protein
MTLLLGGAGGPFFAPHASAGRYFLPPSVAATVAAHAHADLFLYRVTSAVLPSATRIMVGRCRLTPS